MNSETDDELDIEEIIKCGECPECGADTYLTIADGVEREECEECWWYSEKGDALDGEEWAQIAELVSSMIGSHG